MFIRCDISSFFFFNDTATTEIYTLSLHDALPISFACIAAGIACLWGPAHGGANEAALAMLAEIGSVDKIPEFIADRKSTRLNSSHANISYAVFCLKKKKNNNINSTQQHTNHNCDT